jgi:hypothetical protein
MAVEAAQRREAAALYFHHWNAQGRRMKDERLQGGSPLGHDQEPSNFAFRRESLLDRSPTGHQFLAFAQLLGDRRRSLLVRSTGRVPWPVRAGP